MIGRNFAGTTRAADFRIRWKGIVVIFGAATALKDGETV